MKYCPNCQTTYADDALRYCPADGTPLKEVFESSLGAPPVDFNDEETVVSSRQVEPIYVPVERNNPPPPLQSWQSQNRQQNEPPLVAIHPQTGKPKTALTVFLTILGMFLLLGLGVGAWFFMRDKKTEVAVNVNTAPPATNRSPPNINSANSQTVNSANSQTPNQNASVSVSTPTPSATPTAKPTLEPQQGKAITEEVKNVVDDWKNATENLDLDAHLSQYANTVDYYTGGKVSLARVRADKQRAYDQYDSVNINISNLKILPDSSGDKATALFDKEWNFQGDQKSSSGKVQQQLTFAKIGGRWLITGERDLKVYYIGR